MDKFFNHYFNFCKVIDNFGFGLTSFYLAMLPLTYFGVNGVRRSALEKVAALGLIILSLPLLPIALYIDTIAAIPSMLNTLFQAAKVILNTVASIAELALVIALTTVDMTARLLSKVVDMSIETASKSAVITGQLLSKAYDAFVNFVSNLFGKKQESEQIAPEMNSAENLETTTGVLPTVSTNETPKISQVSTEIKPRAKLLTRQFEDILDNGWGIAAFGTEGLDLGKEVLVNKDQSKFEKTSLSA